MMKRLLLAVLLLIAGFVGGMVLTGRLRSADSADAQGGTQATKTPAAPRTVAPPTSQPDFSSVAEQAVKAVTNISSLQPRANSPFASDPFFQYFFGNSEMFGEGRRELSLGSGVIVGRDGYVLTNNHVVGEITRGTEVTVALADKREVRAEVVGVDEWTDLAVLKLDLAGLPVIPWGDSSKLRVAEWVLAIGNPFQLSQTVTLGIVSALGRANIGAATYEDFIQTDAAINPGNSGGALINGRGELVGINTAIYSQSGGYQGVGFAVPSNLARRVMDDIIRYGEVRRGSIGLLETIPLTTRLARDLQVATDRGAVVARMARYGPAYDAGLRPGDVIVSFNGTNVFDPGHFLRLLADAPIGSTARVGVLRGRQRVELTVPVTQGERRTRGRRPL